MRRVLLVECMQEISSFNPVRSHDDAFHVERGEELFRQRGLNTAMGGALSVLEPAGVEIVPAYGARAGSAGPLSAEGWRRLSGELLSAVEAKLDGIDGIYVSLHGAMGTDGELDPEGFLLTEIRRMAGPRARIVISLDLHGILTDRMLRQVDGLAAYWTYPHVDFADTGMRAARLLLRLLEGGSRPTTARVAGSPPGSTTTSSRTRRWARWSGCAGPYRRGPRHCCAAWRPPCRPATTPNAPTSSSPLPGGCGSWRWSTGFRARRCPRRSPP